MAERWNAAQNEAPRTRHLTYEGDDKSGDHKGIRAIIVALVVMACLLVVLLVGFIALSSSPMFTIASIDAEDTEHLSAENIAKLANIEEGTTLLTFDSAAITENLKRNPWVGTVSFTREFPDRLKIEVTERRVDCVVKMSTGSVCWCLGEDSVWIEPVNLTVADGQSADDVALALAQKMDALLITDVPTSLSPTAGETANDEVLKAIAAYREQFSQDFSSQIVCYSASSIESVGCTLKSGIEISLGSPTNIDVKEAVIHQILEKHPNQITYINVRVPSQPTYRRIGTESVSEGTGIQVDDSLPTDDGSGAAPTQTAPTGEQTTEGGENADGTATDGTSADGSAMGDGSSVDGSATGDTSDMILGEDGVYYTYEQYYGLDG